MSRSNQKRQITRLKKKLEAKPQWLMHISFDNDHRLKRNSYLFEYNGIQFKLVQNNNRKFSDSLLTLVPTHQDTDLQKPYEVASDFFSALAWEISARVKHCYSGASGTKGEFRINQAKPNIFGTRHFFGAYVDCSLSRLPKIDTDEQRTALALYKEAGASNNNYLSFLFYYQILDIGGSNPEKIINTINKKRPKELRLIGIPINRLNLRGKSLGYYLTDDFRHAIAHIERDPGKTKLQFNSIEEQHVMQNAVKVVKAFAECHIKTNLNLNQKLRLMRKYKNSIPVFADNEYILQNKLIPAYKYDTY